MDSFTIFVLAYFGIYLVMAPFRQMLTFWGFLLRDWLARIVVSLFIVFVYNVFHTKEMTVSEVLPDQEPVPTLQLSDIMEDDLRERGVEIEMDQPVWIIGEENK